MGKDVIVACDFSSADAVFSFLDKFTDFSLTEQKQLLPHTDDTDGFFYAVFERK